MSKRILIADDTMLTRIVLRSLLSANGYGGILEACDGDEAVRLYELQRPAVVLMDIRMPVVDGISALKQIRSLDPSAKVIMCTAVAQRNVVVEAVRAGAFDFIVKPFQSNRVLDTVSRALRSEAA